MKHDSTEPAPGEANGSSQRQRALTMMLVGATVIAVYLCYQLAAPFFPAIAWATALAIVSYPVYEWLRVHIRSANLAAFITVMLVAVVLVAPTVLLARQLADQAKEGVRFVSASAREIPWPQSLDDYPKLAPLIRWSQQSLDPANELSKFATWLTGQLSWLLTGSFGFATQLLMMLYILFYFIRDNRQGIGRLRSLVPLSDQETDEVFARVEDTINATLYGTVIVGLVQGVVGWCLYMAVGLPAPLLWATLTAVMAIVPILGPSIVWVPAAIILAVQGAQGPADQAFHFYVKAIVITIGGIAIGLIGHFLYPILVGHKLRLHPVMVFFAFFGGLTVFGFSGLILGPAILALTEALVNVWQRRSADGRPAERHGEAKGRPARA